MNTYTVYNGGKPIAINLTINQVADMLEVSADEVMYCARKTKLISGQYGLVKDGRALQGKFSDEYMEKFKKDWDKARFRLNPKARGYD